MSRYNGKDSIHLKVPNTYEGFESNDQKIQVYFRDARSHLYRQVDEPEEETVETHRRFVRDDGKERERERRTRGEREKWKHTQTHREQRGTAAHRRAYLKLQVVTRGLWRKLTSISVN